MNLSFEITKKQREFIEAQADEVLFGGAAGGRAVIRFRTAEGKRKTQSE